MSSRRITPEIARRDYYELWQFLGGSFHQDCMIDHDSLEAVVDEAIGERPRANTKQLLEQWLDVTAKVEDDLDLRRVLAKCFPMAIAFAKPRDAHRFAAMVRGKLEARLKDQTP